MTIEMGTGVVVAEVEDEAEVEVVVGVVGELTTATDDRWIMDGPQDVVEVVGVGVEEKARERLRPFGSEHGLKGSR